MINNYLLDTALNYCKMNERFSNEELFMWRIKLSMNIDENSKIGDEKNSLIVLIKQKIFLIFSKIRFLERVYWRRLHGFKSLSYCAPKMLEKVFVRAKKLGTLDKGDYHEYGIFNGFSLLIAQITAKKYKKVKMNFFGFDSFAGLPSIGKEDSNGYFYQGQYSYPKANVINNINTHGGDLKKIKLIEGFFSKTLNKSLTEKYKMKKIAIAYIDCDLYSSTKDVLKFVKNLLMNDSLIIFDDWNAFLEKSKDKGEQLALKEFLEKNSSIKFIPEFSYCWHGQVFRVKK